MDKEMLEITKKFHDTYEKLASEYTYETREDTKVFDINSSNGKLMYATVNEIVSPILKENQELKLELSSYRQAILNNKEMLGLKEQNDKLKKKYENEVADYETTMFEKEQLNSLVNSCQEENEQLQERIEYLERSNNRREDNWNKLKEHFEFLKINSTGGNREFMEDIVSLMQELEGSDSMKYKLKDGVSFSLINRKSIKKFDFDLSDYYNKETRIFEFPKGYVAFSLMGDVFNSFLFPLDLVEKVEEE